MNDERSRCSDATEPPAETSRATGISPDRLNSATTEPSVGSDSPPDRGSSSESDSQRPPAAASPRGSGASSAEAASNSATRWGRRWAAVGGVAMTFVLAVVTTVATPVGTGLTNWVKEKLSGQIDIAVEDNPEHFVFTAGDAAEYISTKSVETLPAPPSTTDCSGRREWMRKLQGEVIDAGTTTARLTVMARTSTLNIIGAQVVFDGPQNAPLAKPLLKCPPSGSPGGQQLRVIKIDLDAAKVAYQEESEKSITDLKLTLGPGDIEDFRITAGTVRCFCRWRLQVFATLDGKPTTYSIGPDGGRKGTAAENKGQRSFLTSDKWSATPHEFVDDRWKAQPLVRPPLCSVLSEHEARGILGGVAGVDPGDSVNGPSGRTPPSVGECAWRRNAGAVSGGFSGLEIKEATYPDVRAAHGALVEYAEELVMRAGEGHLIAEVQLGDEARSIGDTLVARSGSRVIVIRLQALDSANNHLVSATNVRVGRLVLARLP
jgi:hypothetical protein